MSEKRYTAKQILALVVSLSFIFVAADVAAAWGARFVDISRTPQRQTVDEQNFEQFKQDTRDNFQKVFQKLDMMQVGLTNHIIQM